MAWTVEVTPSAARQIGKLGRESARRISKFLCGRLSTHDDPRQIGKALKGSELEQFWRYRVGGHRLLCEFRDGTHTVLVKAVGHRSYIYRCRLR